MGRVQHEAPSHGYGAAVPNDCRASTDQPGSPLIDQRCQDAWAAAPGAKGAASGDFSTIAGVRSVAEQVNQLGRFNAVIHNAGVGYREPRRTNAEPDMPSVFAVNVLAPYILTALIERPDRLVYVSSGMHRGVRPRMNDLLWTKRSWSGGSAYAESKLCDVMLAFASARRWPTVLSNALEPGWVPTKMGGPSAPGDITKAHVTQAWLATSDDPLARSTGRPANTFIIRSFASPILPGVTSSFRTSYWLNALGFLASGFPKISKVNGLCLWP